MAASPLPLEKKLAIERPAQYGYYGREGLPARGLGEAVRCLWMNWVRVESRYGVLDR
jgi:hypothetical protein